MRHSASKVVKSGQLGVELWSFYCSKRISAPMSYIAFGIVEGGYNVNILVWGRSPSRKLVPYLGLCKGWYNITTTTTTTLACGTGGSEKLDSSN